MPRVSSDHPWGHLAASTCPVPTTEMNWGNPAACRPLALRAHAVGPSSTPSRVGSTLGVAIPYSMSHGMVACILTRLQAVLMVGTALCMVPAAAHDRRLRVRLGGGLRADWGGLCAHLEGGPWAEAPYR